MTDPVPLYERIVGGLLTALATITLDVGGGANAVRVERGRTDPVTEEVCPILLLQEDGETTERLWSGTESHSRALVVEGAVVVAPAAGTDDAAIRRYAAQSEADRLAGLLKARVRASLGAIDAGRTVIDGSPEAVTVTGEAPPQRLTVQTDHPATAFALNVTVEYRTVEGDPFTAA